MHGCDGKLLSHLIIDHVIKNTRENNVQAPVLFFDTKGILYASQYGFRSNHSCEQAITELVGYILQSKNQNEHSASVFLDLSKAFNTPDHQILLSKLSRYGIRGTALDWFGSYLQNRSLVAKITTSPNNVTKSDKYDITYGTAQGSCLGPLLFIIFMNDIHLLPLYSRDILFADNTTIFNSHSSSKYLQYMMEHDLNLMTSWFCAIKLSLNLDKTVVIKFWNFQLHVNNFSIPIVSNTKFLGVHLDNQIAWSVHINVLLDKIHLTR